MKGFNMIKMKSKDKIDFVIIWVDGSDPEWQKEKNKYSNKSENLVDNTAIRYRDWGTLKYWFRGVEKFAPWVNKIHFVTCGQIPKWLNLNNPKLNFVKHSDYMPKEFLPTFSSHSIELNLHRIKDLTEKFVYFNDDMFLTAPIEKEIFFHGNKPIHPSFLHAIVPAAGTSNEVMSHIYVNMVSMINRHFNSNECIENNKINWINPIRNGIKPTIMTLFNSQHNGFVGFSCEHLPVPILKSTMKEVWTKEYDALYQTSKRKFRDTRDVSQYIFRYWDIVSGKSESINPKKLGQYFVLDKNSKHICGAIRKQKYKMICLNDMMDHCTKKEIKKVQKNINVAFETILPDKSSFEL